MSFCGAEMADYIDGNNSQLRQLKHRIFLGHYQEKRRADGLGVFKDVVVVSENEKDLIAELESLRNQLSSVCSTACWIGLQTGLTCCLWVDLKETPFGSYWFRIKAVNVTPTKVTFVLRILRPVSDEDLNPTPIASGEQVWTFYKKSLLSFGERLKSNTLHVLLNPGTLLLAFKYFLMLIFTAAVGLLKVVRESSDFFLKFMREVSILLHTISPWVLGLYDLIAKVVGGFYLLLAMVWRDRKSPQRPADRYRPLSLEYKPSYSNSGIPRYSGNDCIKY